MLYFSRLTKRKNLTDELNHLLPGVVYTVWTLVVYTISQAIWKMIVSQNNIEMNPRVFLSVTRKEFLTSLVYIPITLKTCFQFIIFYRLTLRSKCSRPGLLQTSFGSSTRRIWHWPWSQGLTLNRSARTARFQ